MEVKKPTAEQMAKFKKNAQDPSLSAEVRAKFQAIVDKFSEDVKDVEDKLEGKPESKSRAGRKPSTTKKYKTLPKTKVVALVTSTKQAVEDMKAQLKKLGYNPEEVDALNGNQAFAILEELKSKMVGKPKRTATPRATKKTATDIEQAKAEIKAKTGKTEAECEAIIEQYRALRSKAQEGKRKAEQATATNKKRVAKLEDKGDLIEGTNVKTADAVIESTAKDVAEKIEKQIEAVEEKAQKEAKAEVAKDKTIKTTTDKKEAVEAKVEKKVAEKTKTIVKRVVIDTSALLTSIATTLGKFDKDSQKEFLIKLRSDIDKLLAKYAFGGMTDGATQVMNIQQSNLSASSVNPTLFANGGIVQEDAYSINTIALLNGVRKSENTFQEFKRKLTAIIKRNGYRMPTEKAFEIAYQTNQFAKGGGVAKYPNDLPKAEAEILFHLAHKNSKVGGRLWNNFKRTPLSLIYSNLDDRGIKYANGGGVGGGAKIRIDSVYIDVYEDSYEEGEGRYVNGYSRNDLVGKLVSPKELVSFLSKELYTSDYPSNYSIMDGAIFTSQLVDEDSGTATERQKAEWKKGDLTLYSENTRIGVSIIHPTETTDEELSELTGIGLYKKGGKVKMSKKFANGGVIGQEIVFDDNGEENTGVIKDITNLGDYVVKADDGRTLLAQRDLDVISFGAMRQQGVEQRKKRFGFFDEGGNVSDVEYDDVLAVLEDKLTDAVEELPNSFENSYNAEGEEVEHQSRDGFIAFTDGGYEVRWFETLSGFYGAGYSLPTKALENEKNRQIDLSLEDARDYFKGEYPEIVEELGEDNINYNSLYEAGYESEAEDLSNVEMDMMDGTIMCEIGAYYYTPNNDRGIEGQHTLRLFGLVNLESPYHRSGNLEDRYDIDITFDSIDELAEKVDEGLKEIIDWFNGSHYFKSTEELRIRRMAKGGLTEHGLREGDKIVFDHLVDDNIDVIDSKGKKHIVDLDKGKRYAKGGNVEREKFDKLIGKTNYGEFYFLDDIFAYKDGFKGATGTSIIPVSKEQYDYATSREGILERYMDAIGEEEWLDTLGLDSDDFEDENEMMEAIEEGIYDTYLNGGLDPFDQPNYEIEEQMRALPEFSDEDEYPIFEVVGGGRIFGKNVKFEKIYNQKLYNQIRKVEEFAKGGKLWIDTKGKGGLKGVKPSRKNTFRNEAVKRGLTSGQLASRVLANPSRYKGINPKSAQLVKNMGVRKQGGSIGDILRNRRGQ